MAVASYGTATKSSGVVRILKDLDEPIEGRDVLIVEDIVDSGLTLRYLLAACSGRKPRSLEVCALLSKPEARVVDVPVKYVGFEIPNEFVVGYGLDYQQRYRGLPYVARAQAQPELIRSTSSARKRSASISTATWQLGSQRCGRAGRRGCARARARGRCRRPRRSGRSRAGSGRSRAPAPPRRGPAPRPSRTGARGTGSRSRTGRRRACPRVRPPASCST